MVEMDPRPVCSAHAHTPPQQPVSQACSSAVPASLLLSQSTSPDPVDFITVMSENSDTSVRIPYLSLCIIQQMTWGPLLTRLFPVAFLHGPASCLEWKSPGGCVICSHTPVLRQRPASQLDSEDQVTAKQYG